MNSKPRINLWVYQCASGDGNPGMATDLLANEGWQGVMEKMIKPQLAWLSSLREPVGIVLHLPFGQWTPMMAIDAYDWAWWSKCDYFTRSFEEVWERLCMDHHTVAYVGGLHQPEHLKNRTAYELGRLIKRNLKPLSSIDLFDSICIDTASEAYTHPFTIPIGHKCELNNEILTLSIADSMWGKGKTAIEATPRNHAFCKKLHQRDCYITEPLWRQRHGLPEEQTPGIEKHLYGDRDYLKGTVSRFVTGGYFGNDSAVTLAACQRVLSEGDSLVIAPRLLIENNIPATALLDN